MNDSITVKVFEVVGSGYCVAADDGQLVYDRIAGFISAERNVTLSFAHVTRVTSAFLNAAIGQLYGRFPEAQIREHLGVVDIRQDDLGLIKQVVDTAKAYFKDPARFEQARAEAVGSA